MHVLVVKQLGIKQCCLSDVTDSFNTYYKVLFLNKCKYIYDRPGASHVPPVNIQGVPKRKFLFKAGSHLKKLNKGHVYETNLYLLVK